MYKVDNIIIDKVMNIINYVVYVVIWFIIIIYD